MGERGTGGTGMGVRQRVRVRHGAHAGGAGDSIMRLVDELQVFAPPGTLDPAQELRLPDGTKWTVEGNAEDYSANPWFKPGLVVIHCKRVEG